MKERNSVQLLRTSSTKTYNWKPTAFRKDVPKVARIEESPILEKGSLPKHQ